MTHTALRALLRAPREGVQRLVVPLDVVAHDGLHALVLVRVVVDVHGDGHAGLVLAVAHVLEQHLQKLTVIIVILKY